MATITNTIQWGDNTAQLAANLKAGVDQLEAMHASVDTLTSSVDGSISTFLDGIPIVGQFIGALTVEKLFEFVDGAIEVAASIENLSIATGISTDALQQLAYVGEGFGVGMDTIGRSVEMFSANLANGNGNAVKAVEMLGLSVSDLLAAGPQEAFLQFADAAGQVSDPMTKAAIASDALGRSGKELLPVLGDIRTAMQDVPQTALIDPVTLKSAADFDTALAHLGTTLKAWTVDAVGIGSNILTGLGGFFSEAKTGFASVEDSAVDAGSKIPAAVKPAIDSTQEWANYIADLKGNNDALSDSLAAQILQDADAGASVKDLAAHYDVSTASITALIAENKKYEAALTELDGVGATWQDTLQGMNADVVQAIEYYLQAGVSQNSLAAAYGLTATQVKAVASALKDEQAQDKLNQETDAAWVTVETATYTTLAALYGTDTQKAEADADAKYDAAVAEAQKKGITDVNYYNALWALRDLDVQKSNATYQALYQGSMEQLQKALQIATDALNVAMDSGLTLSVAKWQQLRDNIEKARDAIVNFNNAGVSATGNVATGGQKATVTFDNLQVAEAAASDGLDPMNIKVQNLDGSVVSLADAIKQLDAGSSEEYDLSTAAGIANYQQQNPGASITWSNDQIEAFIKAGGTLQELINSGVINPYAAYTMPGFATGVDDFAGGFAMVGEMGPEAMYVPPHASISPAGDMPGLGGDTYVVNVTGAFGTMQQVTDAVSKGILASTGLKVSRSNR